MSESYAIGARNKSRQLREYAAYDKKTVHSVLDAAFVAHVGFVQDGAPVVVPMMYGRRGEVLYLHGARKARVIRLLESNATVCACVTLFDGLVAARSAFNSSMNYRAAMVFGAARVLEDEGDRLDALRTITEHALPGRWDTLRDPTRKELLMTGVIELEIEEASAKVSSGDPEDEPEDYALSTWAGVIPMQTVLGRPVADPGLAEGIELPECIDALAGKVL